MNALGLLTECRKGTEIHETDFVKKVHETTMTQTDVRQTDVRCYDVTNKMVAQNSSERRTRHNLT